MSFWPALSVASKLERMKRAEAKLLSFAGRFGGESEKNYVIKTLDTPVPRHVLPMVDVSTHQSEEPIVIHSVQVQSQGNRPGGIPLVLLHGYMNAAAYFYRNLIGLSRHFQSVHSLDLLGWGLSSRPKFEFDSNKDEITATEDFFVESLEAWRKYNEISKMHLAGHSMGGHIAIAYCEKYPQHVERLLLLSPVGVPEESEEVRNRRAAMINTSWRFWLLATFAKTIFNYSSIGAVLRTIPSTAAERLALSYVERRLPAISNPDEQRAVTEYLLANSMLPGSGEYCLNKLLTPNAYGKRPTEFRIPDLKVSNVAMLYGEHDWMDPKGGVSVQRRCKDTDTSPRVNLYSIRTAGHLLMLENWAEFNAAIVLGAGGSHEELPSGSPLPLEIKGTI